MYYDSYASSSSSEYTSRTIVSSKDIYSQRVSLVTHPTAALQCGYSGNEPIGPVNAHINAAPLALQVQVRSPFREAGRQMRYERLVGRQPLAVLLLRDCLRITPSPCISRLELHPHVACRPFLCHQRIHRLVDYLYGLIECLLLFTQTLLA